MNSRCNISQHWKPDASGPSPIQSVGVHLHALVIFYVGYYVYTSDSMRFHCSQKKVRPAKVLLLSFN